MAQGTYVSVGADVSPVKPALDSVSKAAQQTANDVNTAFNGWTTSAKKTEEAHWGLFGALKEVRGEARQHQRVFNFYGQQLASITGLTKGFGAELAGLGIALGSGMWFVAVIEGVKALAGGFEFLSEKAKEATKEAAAFRKEFGKIQDEVTKREATQRLKKAGFTSAEIESILGGEASKLDEMVVDADIRIHELKETLNRALENGGGIAFRGVVQQYKQTGDPEKLRAYTEEYQLTQQIAAEKAKIAEIEGTLNRIRKIGRQEGDEERSGQALNAQQKAFKAAKALNDQKLADELKATDYEYDLADKSEEDKLKAFKKAKEEHDALLKQQLGETEAYYDGQDALAKEAALRLKNDFKDTGRLLAPLANGFENLFRVIIKGGKGSGDAIRAMGLQMLQNLSGVLVQMGLEQLKAAILGKAIQTTKDTAAISGSAGVAGAEVTAQMASNPFTLAGAIPAGEAMAAAVIASFEPYAAASGGFDIGNYNPLTQLHAREMVLPAELADNVRNMTSKSGPKGNTYIINALDTKSFYAALKANDGALIKVLDNAAAEGRF